MSQTLIELMHSLADIMEEESELLSAGSWPPHNEALAAAKTRLTGSLEAILAEQDRTSPDWLSTTPADNALGEAVARLRQASVTNATLLSRQIELSQELLQEIAREASRVSGNRQQTYQRGGQLRHRDGPTPVTLNTSL